MITLIQRLETALVRKLPAGNYEWFDVINISLNLTERDEILAALRAAEAAKQNLGTAAESAPGLTPCDKHPDAGWPDRL